MGPLCFDAPIAQGAPCSCGEMPPALAVCGAGAKDKTFTFKTCTFPIDDAKRTLGPPVRNCMEKIGDDCVDVKCCPGLTCTLDPASMRSSCK